MRHEVSLAIGPVSFRVGSAWKGPVEALAGLYADYPAPEDEVCDFTVRLEPEKPWRRWLRPSVAIHGDYMLPDAVPLSLAHGLLAAEMGMNLQMALGQKSFLLLHAATVEKDGKALILTGESGAGKSTLSALLGESGWRLMGDEFALLDCETGLLHPFPRAISLKNGAIAVMENVAGEGRFGPVMEDTPKGRIRHLKPRADAIARMREPARPALILFPRFGEERAMRAVGPAEVFMRLTHASTNYVALGARGFDALSGLVALCPALAIDYPDTETALGLVEELWRELPA
ncbi:MAG TPA: HprK-related kinase A [Allosphingosinicella sp.]|jgi:HprK-related kinase A|nr:HprK-related kinase A [Allosphingosinicella sp.]